MIEKEDKVVLVGPFSEPIGGVSTHVESLARGFSAAGIKCTVLDLYPRKNKIKVSGIEHCVCSRRGLAQFIWLYRQLRNHRSGVVHFHFSTLLGKFLVACWLAIGIQRRTILTLHHGDQEDIFLRHNLFFRMIAKLVLRARLPDKIVALNEQQVDFYSGLGVQSNRIDIVASPAVGRMEVDRSLLPETVKGLVAIEDGGFESLLMTSGYPNDCYRFEDSIEMVERLNDVIRCRLIVCLYERGGNTRYEAEIRRRLESSDKVIVIGPLARAGFLALLKLSSVYVRPSKADSCGLTIGEAIELGTPCIASNVCERDSRCKTFSAGDMEQFYQSSLDLLVKQKELGRRTVLGAIDGEDECVGKLLALYSLG